MCRLSAKHHAGVYGYRVTNQHESTGFNHRVGANVARLRTAAGMSQARLAHELALRDLPFQQQIIANVEKAIRPLKFEEAVGIAEILGVPPEDRSRVLEFGNAAAPSLDLGLGYGEFRRVERGLKQFETWLDAHLNRLRRESGDDLMSQLVRVQEEGVGLDDAELKAPAGLVLAAGFETTVNLLGNGIALLREHPDQLQRLRDDPALWPNAVDEVLRFDPPVLLTGRLCTADTDVAGVPVQRGEVVTTLLAGANRDPDVFEDPGTFDVGRANARDHVSFSAGRHYCLGAALARMEGEVGLRTLFDRFPDLRLEPGASRRSTRILRGYEHLPARLVPSEAPVG